MFEVVGIEDIERGRRTDEVDVLGSVVSVDELTTTGNGETLSFEVLELNGKRCREFEEGFEEVDLRGPALGSEREVLSALPDVPLLSLVERLSGKSMTVGLGLEERGLVGWIGVGVSVARTVESGESEES